MAAALVPSASQRSVGGALGASQASARPGGRAVRVPERRVHADGDANAGHQMILAAMAAAPPAAAPPRPARYTSWDLSDDEERFVLDRSTAAVVPKCVVHLVAKKFAFRTGKSAAAKAGVTTHTQLDAAFYRQSHPCGVVVMPQDARERTAALTEFYREMALDIDAVEEGRGRHLFFSECGPADPADVCVLFFDVDLFVAPNDPAMVESEADRPTADALLARMAPRVARCVAGAFPAAADAAMVVCCTDTVVRAKGGKTLLKLGVHLYWPGIRVSRARHEMVWRLVLADLRASTDEPDGNLFDQADCTLGADWRSVLDENVVAQRALRMIGSDKLEPCKCAKTADAAACRHMRSPIPDRRFIFDRHKRYRLFAVFDGAGERDAARTQAYRDDTHALLLAVSLAIPRPRDSATECALPLDHLAQEFKAEDDEFGNGAVRDEDESVLTWTFVARHDLQGADQAVFAFLWRYAAQYFTPDCSPETAARDVVDTSGLHIGVRGKGKKRWWKLQMAASWACPNLGRPHNSERNYLFVTPVPDMQLTMRCGCKCPTTDGRRNIGLLKPVQCSWFECTQLPAIGSMFKMHITATHFPEMWSSALAKRIAFPPAQRNHPDLFARDPQRTTLQNDLLMLTAHAHIAHLKSERRWMQQPIHAVRALAAALGGDGGAAEEKKHQQDAEVVIQAGADALERLAHALEAHDPGVAAAAGGVRVIKRKRKRRAPGDKQKRKKKGGEAAEAAELERQLALHHQQTNCDDIDSEAEAAAALDAATRAERDAVNDAGEAELDLDNL